MAVAAPGRRADGDEHRLRRPHRAGKLGRKRQPALAHVLRHQLRQPRLEDRHLSPPQRRNLLGVLVDAADLVPEIRKTRPRHQTNIPRSDHRYAHEGSPHSAIG